MIPEIDEREWEILQTKPAIGISIIETKYSNRVDVISALNVYMNGNNLTQIKDKWERFIAPIEPFITQNEYMKRAILQDNVELFDAIFMHEVQCVMLDSLAFSRYVLRTLTDCINFDALYCIRYVLNNDYTRDELLFNWLPNASISGYWFKAISRHTAILNAVFVDTNVINMVDSLDRDVIYSMITESALRCGNADILEWCIHNYWNDTNNLFNKYHSEPYLDEDLLMTCFELLYK